MEKYLAYVIVTIIVMFMFFIVILSYYSMKKGQQSNIKTGEIRSTEKIVLKEDMKLSREELKEYLQKAGINDISEGDIDRLLNGETIKIVKKVGEKKTTEMAGPEYEEPYRTK